MSVLTAMLLMPEHNKSNVDDVGTKQKNCCWCGNKTKDICWCRNKKKHSLIGIKNSIKFNDSMSWFPFAFDNVFLKSLAKTFRLLLLHTRFSLAAATSKQRETKFTKTLHISPRAFCQLAERLLDSTFSGFYTRLTLLQIWGRLAKFTVGNIAMMRKLSNETLTKCFTIPGTRKFAQPETNP